MKTFWRQAAIFGGVLALVTLMLVFVFYFKGIGSGWVAHKLGGETDQSIGRRDIEKLKQIIDACEQTPALPSEIETYTNTSEWIGFVFINTKAGTVYSFSTNHQMLAIYQVPKTPSETTSSLTPSQPSQEGEPQPEIDMDGFAFYRCTPEQLEQVEALFDTYFK